MRGAMSISILLLVVPGPVAALSWTRVDVVPAADVFSVQRHGTTLYAGSKDTVFIGADEGTTWTPTAVVDSEATAIETVVPADGALWAGTFGHGVYRSVDAGAHWEAVNAGLVGLGAMHVVDLVERSGKLHAGTLGAGTFVLDLASPTMWSAFNDGLPVSISGNVNVLVLHGSTLVAAAGANGFVYRLPEGETTWQEVAIVPPIAPGLQGSDLESHGGDLLAGTTSRAYRSSDDAQTWEFAGNGLAQGLSVFLTSSGPAYFAAVDFFTNTHRLYRSTDRGDSWQQLDDQGAFVYDLEVAGDKLWAARSDGLWWTPLAAVAVESSRWGSIKNKFRD